MSIYGQVLLGEPALVYMRARFETGANMKSKDNQGRVREIGKALSRSLLAAVDLEAGIVSTFLPPEAGTPSAGDFPHGRRFDGGAARLQAICESYLDGGADRVCIFEEPLGLATDPWVQNSDLPIVTCGANLYYVATLATAPDALSSALRHASSAWPGALGVFAEVPIVARSIETPLLNSIAASADEIIVGAFDGEGFLWWRRAPERREVDGRR